CRRRGGKTYATGIERPGRRTSITSCPATGGNLLMVCAGARREGIGQRFYSSYQSWPIVKSLAQKGAENGTCDHRPRSRRSFDGSPLFFLRREEDSGAEGCPMAIFYNKNG